MFHRIAFILTLLLAFTAQAQEYPSRTVTLVVPYPLSGPTDIRGASRMTKTYKLMAAHAPPAISDTLSRIVQQAIRYESKHPVLLERQPGGATTRGAQHVARAPADGHTLLLASNETMVLTPNYASEVGYDPTRIEGWLRMVPSPQPLSGRLAPENPRPEIVLKDDPLSPPRLPVEPGSPPIRR